LIRINDVGVVQRDTGGTQMWLRRRAVGSDRSGAESMESERCLMREDAFSSRPKPNDDELLVLALVYLHKSIDAAADRHDAACAHMLNGGAARSSQRAPPGQS
jgi:hypothetical protein